MPKQAPMYPNRPVSPLVARAQRVLGHRNEELGARLGVSKRTVVRWWSRGATLSLNQVRTLARLVHPKDPALAEEIAAAASETLESLGLVSPAQPPPPLPVASIVEAVVCAAADALNAPPGAARGAVLAAFRRARELRLSVNDVEAALTPPPPPSKSKGAAGSA